MASRVFLLGVGGLSLDLLDPLIHRGWIPNLEYLLGRGVVGSLTSDLPPFAAAEWSTLLTGEGPGTTGFLEGWRKASGSYFPEAASLSTLALRAPGSLLGRNSETVLVGVPLPGDPGSVHTEEAIQILKWKGGKFSVRTLDFSTPTFLGECDSGARGEETPECVLEEAIRRMVVLSVSIARTVRESNARVYGIHFAGLDRILSLFQRDLLSALLGRNGVSHEALLRQFFRVFDDALGAVLELSRKTDSMIVLASAHGFAPAHRVMNLNAFLISRGYLVLRPEGSSETLLREVAAPVLRAMKIERRRIRKILGRPTLREVLDRTGSLLSSEIGLFDWGRTRAFALSRTGITLNVKGVESQGMVNPGPEARTMGEEIRKAILSLIDPATGKLPAKEVVWREEVFKGPGLPELPHLILRNWDSGYVLEDWRKVAPDGEIFSNPESRTGSPQGPGFYCLHGSGHFLLGPRSSQLRSFPSRTLPEIVSFISSALDGKNSPSPDKISQPS